MTETLMPGGLWFDIRPETTDWNTVYACAVEDEYDVAKEPWGKDSLVFDFGAHIGGFTILAASKGAKVVAVEPVPDNARLVARNAELNDCTDRVVVVNRAIGAEEIWFGFDQDATAVAHAYIGSTEGDAGSAGAQSAKVGSVTLMELCEQHGIPDVLKLDCEGGEWAVLEERILRDVALIVGEWHPTSGHTRDAFQYALEGSHVVTFTGPAAGPGGFRAEIR